MDAFEVTAFDRQVARYLGTDGYADGIVLADYVFCPYFLSDHCVDTEPDTFFLHQPDTAVDDIFSQFEVRDTEAEEATGQFVFFKDCHFVPFTV